LEEPFMRRSHIATILLTCFFSLTARSPSFVFAQQPPQASEKERGVELYRKGDFNEAVKALREALKKQASDSDAWYYLGLSLHRAGKVEDARKAFEKTVSLRRDFAPGYAAMAYMQLLVNDNKRAIENAEKALALDPKNLDSLYIAGTARLREGAGAEALARAEEALKVKPDHPQALILKTQALLNMFAKWPAKAGAKTDQREDDKPSDDAAGEAKRRSHYSLLKSASESLEAYLKLGAENSDQDSLDSLRDQLEELRFYARRADDAGSNDSEAPMTAALRPTILYRERAHYTDAALDARVRGTIILMVVFADDGVLKHILVIQGLSHGLTEEAVKAARKIRFTPAMRDGKPISVFGRLEFTFN
jgi:tetratricopeptide (TPR) repeat protein